MTTASRIRTEAPASGVPALRDAAARATRRYLQDRGAVEADSLYALVLSEVESGVLGELMRHCEGNQSKAAAILGINRATLRKKLDALRLSD